MADSNVNVCRGWQAVIWSNTLDVEAVDIVGYGGITLVYGVCCKVHAPSTLVTWG